MLRDIIEYGTATLKKKLDNQSQILIKNSFWIFIANLTNQVLFLFRSIVIARGLGVEIYGIYVVAIAFINNIQELLNLNVGTPLTRYGAIFKTHQRIDKLTALIKACFYAAFLSSLVSIILIAILLAFFYNVFLTKPGLYGFIILLAITESFSFYDFLSTSLLRLYSRFKLNSIISIIISFIEFSIITLAIILFPKNLQAFFLAVVVASLLHSIILNFAAYWELRHEIFPHIHVNVKILKDQWREIRKFTINNSVSRSVQTLAARGDVLLLGAFAGPIQVGLYNIGKRLTSALNMIVSPLSQAIYPQLSMLVAKRSYKEIKQMLIKISKLAAYPSLAFLVVIYFIRKVLIEFLYGKEFTAASGPFFILLITAVISSVFFWSLYLVVSLGMISFRLVVNLLSLGLGSIIALLFISQGGIGVAYGVLTATVTLHILFVFYSFKRLHRESL